MEKENKKKPHQLLLTERQLEMVEKLKKETGMTSTSYIFFQALDSLHKAYFPAYRQGGSSFQSGSLEDRARAKIDMKAMTEKVKQDNFIKEKTDICINQFHGRVEDGICFYTSYGFTPSDDMELNAELEECTEMLAENTLFIPTKEAVLKHRPELKNI